MLPYRARRLTEPDHQWCDKTATVHRMSSNDGAFGFGERADLVEDRRRHEQLADVVQQPGPLQPIERAVAESELLIRSCGCRPGRARNGRG